MVKGKVKAGQAVYDGDTVRQAGEIFEVDEQQAAAMGNERVEWNPAEEPPPPAPEPAPAEGNGE